MKPKSGSKIGIALTTIGKQPINGLRSKEENTTNGWYIWCGETMQDHADFFQPLHIEHIDDYLPEILKYLDLPIGFRFLIDNNGYEDIWYDKGLIDA